MTSHFAFIFGRVTYGNLSYLVKIRVGTRFAGFILCEQPQLRKESYVKMDHYFSNHRLGSRAAGVHRHRGHGYGNREDSVLHFSDFISGVIDSPPGRQMTRLQKGYTDKQKRMDHGKQSEVTGGGKKSGSGRGKR